MDETSNRRKWLIISYFTDIDTLACSHHIDDRITELRSKGIDPIILSDVCSPPSSDHRKTRTPSIAPSGMRYEMRYITKRMFPNKAIRNVVNIPFLLSILPAYALESLVLNFDCTWSWFLCAGIAAINICKKNDIDIIYSTGGPFSAHLAAFMCARKTGLPWIAEYQDPIVGDWVIRRKTEQALMSKIENMVAKNADAIVYMTQIALEKAERRCSMGVNGHVVYPGASADIFDNIAPQRKPNRKLTLGHFGSFGGNRNAGVVLKALESLAIKYPDAEKQIRLLLLGDMDRAQEVMLNEYPYQEMLDVRGKCSRTQSFQNMLTCDLLLLIQNASSGSSVSIPSKTYEYLHSGIPTFALTYENLELQKMLVDLGHFAIDMQETALVYETLEQVYLNWKESGRVNNKIDVSPYTTSAAAQRLMEIGNTITK